MCMFQCVWTSSPQGTTEPVSGLAVLLYFTMQSAFCPQSFDPGGDFEQEVARCNSVSLAQSGLYSSSIDGSAINISIDQEAGITCT